MPIVGQFGSPAGFGVFPGGALESIATVTVGSGGASSITLSSIPGTFQHVQLRYLLRFTGTTYNDDFATMQANSSGGTAYAAHELYGNGSAAGANAFTSRADMVIQNVPTANRTASVFAGGVIDLLDYTSTSKNKTARMMVGYDSNGAGIISVISGLWANTSAVTSLTLSPSGTAGNFAQHSTVALYGVRA